MTHTGSDATLAADIAGWLPAARWFPAKSQAVERVAIVERISLPVSSPAELVAVEVRVSTQPAADPQAATGRFVVPIRWQSGHAEEAAAAPEVARWLTTAALTGARAAGPRSCLVGQPVPSQASSLGFDAWAAQSVRVSHLATNSSNTLVRVQPAGEPPQGGMICKLLRQMRPGLQPEVEIGHFLADDPQWHSSPPLRGSLEWQTPGGESVVVAVVHEEVTAAVSLWDELLRRLRTASGDGDLDQALARLMQAVGTVTAAMHTALAADRGDAAFGTLAWSKTAQEEAAVAMSCHAREVFADVRRKPPAVPELVTGLLDEVLAEEPTWLAMLTGLAAAPLHSHRIRVHGDYHLGQLLYRPSPLSESLADCLQIIDFEGEPQRSLQARREKHSAAKDVAGMLRSLDYVVRVADQETDTPCPPKTLDRLTAWFLESYTAAAQGHAYWPADAREAGRLLSIYSLDKAIYEVAYEASHRPEWLGVPLAALSLLAAREK